jgi:hypothetical protein
VGKGGGGRSAVRVVFAAVAFGVLATPAPADAHEVQTGTPHRASTPQPAPSTWPRAASDLRLAQTGTDPAGPDVQPTPRAECGPGSNPESGAQGRVPKSEVDSGRAAQGYSCNAIQLGHIGASGGYKVERYVDGAGRECAYYDTTLLFPTSPFNQGNVTGGDVTGVAVLDMSDPRKPVRTETLVTPAMQSPHESMSLNQRRGLLAAATSSPVFAPGTVDIYDVSADCRHPVLKASAPMTALGHEGGFAPDGNTFYVVALHQPVLTAIDVSNPATPITLGVYPLPSHGISVSDDGNRLYMAAYTHYFDQYAPEQLNYPGAIRGLKIYDVSDVQARRPNPQMREISQATWALVSTPQINVPVTIGGTPYLVEMDEYEFEGRVGAGRIIDISDEKQPKVVSNLRLEVHQAAARAGDQAADPGADFSLQGYAGHYCNVPRRVDPGIVACTFILSGLRVFDIRDPLRPREIAYYNGPIRNSAWAMSNPAFVPERGEIWYSDGNSGFYAVKLTNGVWPFPEPASTPAATAWVDGAAGTGGASSVPAGGRLPATGLTLPMLAALATLVAGLGLRRLPRSPLLGASVHRLGGRTRPER